MNSNCSVFILSLYYNITSGTYKIGFLYGWVKPHQRRTHQNHTERAATMYFAAAASAPHTLAAARLLLPQMPGRPYAALKSTSRRSPNTNRGLKIIIIARRNINADTALTIMVAITITANRL